MFLALNVKKKKLNSLMIMDDFEKAAMNAALFLYPNTKIQGCFFHLGQSIWRQIQNNGLSIINILLIQNSSLIFEK